MRALKVYIAGPMTGYPLWNFPAFDEAAEYLRACGYEVVNPADLDRAVGFDETAEIAPPGFLRGALKRDLAAICECDAVAVLEGWRLSRGAMLEVLLANRLGLLVIDAETTENLSEDIEELVKGRIMA